MNGAAAGLGAGASLGISGVIVAVGGSDWPIAGGVGRRIDASAMPTPTSTTAAATIHHQAGFAAGA